MSARCKAADVNLHANCVAIKDTGILIVGPSGGGKSSLSLQLMALGAVLVSDDRTDLTRDGDQIIASPPPATAGLIEARGIGLLNADHRDTASVQLVIDLEQTEMDRLPVMHYARILDVDLPCLHKVDGAHFPAAILQYVLAGRRVPE